MINYLSIEGLTHHWGENALFQDLSYGINEGQKVALIAKNGAGKTTLMNIISGALPPDSGKVIYRNGIRVGYLAQDPLLSPELTVIEAVFATNNEVVNTIKQYEAALTEENQDKIGHLITEMDKLNAWDYEARIKQILNELNISNFQQPIRELSGGQKKRVALAATLISEPEFLILDEPTNHLDLNMIEWLEEYLNRSKATLLMVTHDRYFLDRVCNEIVELADRTLYNYKGNYSYFLEKREERIFNKNSEIERAKNLLRKEQDWMNRQPQARATKAKYRIDAFYDLKDKASQSTREAELNLDIKTTRLGKKIIEFSDIKKSFDTKVILDGFTYKFAHKEKVGIVGNNGTGKSTFLNILTQAIEPDSGTIEIGETLVFGYFHQQGIVFDENKKVIEIISDISENISLGSGKSMNAAAFLRHFLFPNEMHYSEVAKLSGGEKKRLYLMTILMKNPNFLILDEPTNDLDIFTLNVLEEYLQSFEGCLLIVTHDRYFMDKLVDHIFVFEGNGVIKDFPGNYSDLHDARERIAKESKPVAKKESTQKENPVASTKEKARKLSFNEKRELELLEKELEELENEKEELNSQINSGTLPVDKLVEKSSRYSEILKIQEEKEFRWLELSDI
ncbi:MAG: ABC-F family ATP-binding cassette domain-containing protein [Breznakibacter sp.]|nr:ABC-F family ATP-binding cassette domain-containing protein [Breznakibacter sp.]